MINMLKRAWTNFTKLDFHIQGVVIAIPCASALLAYLISLGAEDLIFSEWFLTCVSIPSLFANQLTLFSHLGRIGELLTHEPQHKTTFKIEYIGTMLGLGMGCILGIGFASYNIVVPLIASLGTGAHLLFAFRQINIFASLGNRIGRTLDTNTRPWNEKFLLGIGIILGFTLGIGLCLTANIANISIMGVAVFLNGAAELPFWLSCIIFTLSVASALASAAEYCAKSSTFIRSYYTEDKDVLSRIRLARYDYVGSIIGSTLGLLLGIVSVSAMCIYAPQMLPGKVGMITAGLILASTISVVGSIFSQCGRVVDAINRIPIEEKFELENRQNIPLMLQQVADNDGPDNTPTLTPQPTRSPSPNPGSSPRNRSSSPGAAFRLLPAPDSQQDNNNDDKGSPPLSESTRKFLRNKSTANFQ